MTRRKWAVLLLVGIFLLTAAGCGPKEPETPAAEADMTADVIVVGGGGAGLAAAVSAAENGASVILIEKAANLGGNTLVAGCVQCGRPRETEECADERCSPR